MARDILPATAPAEAPAGCDAPVAGAWRNAIRYLWAAPCTVVGALIGMPLCCLGASARRVDGVMEVGFASAGHPCARVLLALPFAGITLGHVVLAPTHAWHTALRPHERVHVAQYERWGILFLVLYPASSLLQLLRGGRPYLDNHFEVQARALGGRPEPHSGNRQA